MRAIQTLVLAVMALFVIGADATAQGTPNFSGTWVLSPESIPKSGGTRRRTGTGSTAGMSGRSGSTFIDNNRVHALTCGAACTITQTARTLTIKRPADAQGGVAPPVVVLNLDGSDSKNQQAGRNGGPPTVYVARAKWSGNTLVVTREHEGQFVATQTLSLQDGQLTIAYSVNLDVTGSTLIYTKK